MATNDVLIVGVNKLKNLIPKVSIMYFELDGKIYEIKDVNEKSVITNKGKINWESISDRKFPDENGLMIFYGPKDQTFYFKLTDEERKEHPYNNWMHIKADLEDEWRDKKDQMMENKNTKTTISELRKIIRQVIKESGNFGDYAQEVAFNIKDETNGKSEKEIIGLIKNYVFNDPAVGRQNQTRTWNVVFGDEDFIPDVLQCLR